jgi:hypothetical protein
VPNIGETRNAYEILVGRLEGNRRLRRQRFDSNDFKETGYDEMD